jgi:ribosomal protein L11 methyltransferase
VLRLAIRVARADAEIVLVELLELAPSGVEEVDVSDDVVEYAVYGSPGELPELPDLSAACGEALIEVSTSVVADDWAERWREFHKPLVLDGLTVRPPWEPLSESVLDVVIDPGQAFGTGAHATTRLCLELLLGVEARGAFVDIGCGSGVLAIVAARLGYGPVLAFDFDPLSVEASAVNAAVNGVAVAVERLDLRSDPLPDLGGATVAANLLRPLLLLLASRLADLPGRLIASGLLEHEADEVSAAFAARGLVERERRTLGGWSALMLEQPT